MTDTSDADMVRLRVVVEDQGPGIADLDTWSDAHCHRHGPESIASVPRRVRKAHSPQSELPTRAAC